MDSHLVTGGVAGGVERRVQVAEPVAQGPGPVGDRLEAVFGSVQGHDVVRRPEQDEDRDDCEEQTRRSVPSYSTRLPNCLFGQKME